MKPSGGAGGKRGPVVGESGRERPKWACGRGLLGVDAMENSDERWAMSDYEVMRSKCDGVNGGGPFNLARGTSTKHRAMSNERRV